MPSNDTKTKELQALFKPKTTVEDKLIHNGAITCKFWLANELWNDELPIESPPQKGSAVVDFFINHEAAPKIKNAFITGWDNYLEDPAFLG